VDPAFPNRPLVVHVVRPRDYDVGTPVLFVHHGVDRNGGDYRDYWLNLVDHADILAVSIEFPEVSFPNIRGNNLAICTTRTACRTGAKMDVRYQRNAVRPVARAGRHDLETL
jgi:hypothetical protein